MLDFHWLTIPLWQWTVGLLLSFTLLWYIGYRLSNAGIVDVAWGFSFPLLFWIEMLAGGLPLSPHAWVVGGLLTLAQGRLGWYLLLRFFHEHPQEDGRYSKFRCEWTSQYGSGIAEWCMWGLFLLQGALILVLMLPLWWASKNPEALSLFDWAALGIGLGGMALETIADTQLKFFKQEARKTSSPHSICQTGLWRWSRHPNYLGQWLLWVAYGLLAINHHNAWVFVYAPLLMGYFLTYMTGIKLTEDHMLATRGEPYRQYQERTAPFIPGLQWPNFTPKS